MLGRIILPVALCFCHFVSARAQSPLSSSAIPAADTLASYRLSFQRMLNTFIWDGRALGSWTLNDVRMVVDQRGTSRLVRSSGVSRQDEYEGSIGADFPVAEDISLDARQRSTVVGGIRGFELNEISRHSLLIGPTWRPVERALLHGAAGWEWNAQQERKGSGLRFAVAGEASDIAIEDMLLSARASMERSDLGDRRPEDMEAGFSAISDFGHGSGNVLEVSYKKQGRDLYAAGASAGSGTDVSLLRRKEEGVQLGNTLSVGSFSDLSGSVRIGIAQRRIDRAYEPLDDSRSATLPLPSAVQQSSFDISGSAVWAPFSAFAARMNIAVSSAEESHSVSQDVPEGDVSAEQQSVQARRRSNSAERVVTSTVIDVLASRRTRVTASGSASILRYDTPDTLNTDDRDEAFFNAGVTVEHRLSPGLMVSAAVEGGLSHLVYVSRFQSANNVRVRTVRLVPAFEWDRPGVFRNRLQAEVAASYTVYDFEDLLGAVQSFSYRQASWNDSLEVTLSGSMQLEFTGSLRLFERGVLRWKEFRERPERAFTEVFVWPLVSYRAGSGVVLGVGYRSFLQQRFRYNGRSREFEGSVGSAGPTVSLSAAFQNGSRITFTGWRETQRSSGTAFRSLSNVSLSVQTRL